MENNNETHFTQNIGLTIPAIVFVLWSYISQYVDILALFACLTLILIYSFPTTRIITKTISLISLFLLLYLFIHHLIPGFNPLIMDYINNDKSIHTSTNIWTESIFLIFLLTPGYFIKNHRWKVSHIDESDIQIIHYLSPKYVSYVISYSLLIIISLSLFLAEKFELSQIHLQFPSYIDTGKIVYLLFSATLIELIRGNIQHYFTHSLKWLAIFPTSFLMTLLIIPNDLNFLAYAFIINLTYSFTLYKTNYIFSTIIIHFISNVILFYLLTPSLIY